MEIKRKHYSLTCVWEKKILNFLARKIYRLITADQLSYLALGGSFLAAAAYLLAANDLAWLHLANFGIFVQWFGDSLDGRTARLRKENRPCYGHYFDHILDAISMVVIIFGINYSSLTLQSEWMWVLSLFLLIMIHAYLKSSLTGVFELTIERFGGTEARLFLMFINFLLIFTGNPLIIAGFLPLNLIDVLGCLVAVMLLWNFWFAVSRTLWGKHKLTDF